MRRVTDAARQTPPGARPDSTRSRAARPSVRVGRSRLSATAALDGWSPITEPGLQASPSPIRTPTARDSVGGPRRPQVPAEVRAERRPITTFLRGVGARVHGGPVGHRSPPVPHGVSRLLTCTARTRSKRCGCFPCSVRKGCRFHGPSRMHMPCVFHLLVMVRELLVGLEISGTATASCRIRCSVWSRHSNLRRPSRSMTRAPWASSSRVTVGRWFAGTTVPAGDVPRTGFGRIQRNRGSVAPGGDVKISDERRPRTDRMWDAPGPRLTRRG